MKRIVPLLVALIILVAVLYFGGCFGKSESEYTEMMVSHVKEHGFSSAICKNFEKKSDGGAVGTFMVGAGLEADGSATISLSIKVTVDRKGNISCSWCD